MCSGTLAISTASFRFSPSRCSSSSATVASYSPIRRRSALRSALARRHRTACRAGALISRERGTRHHPGPNSDFLASPVRGSGLLKIGGARWNFSFVAAFETCLRPFVQTQYRNRAAPLLLVLVGHQLEVYLATASASGIFLAARGSSALPPRALFQPAFGIAPLGAILVA